MRLSGDKSKIFICQLVTVRRELLNARLTNDEHTESLFEMFEEENKYLYS